MPSARRLLASVALVVSCSFACGGDPPEKAADIVLHLVADDAGDSSGRFFWIADGQQAPIETPWT